VAGRRRGRNNVCLIARFSVFSRFQQPVIMDVEELCDAGLELVTSFSYAGKAEVDMRL